MMSSTAKRPGHREKIPEKRTVCPKQIRSRSSNQRYTSNQRRKLMFDVALRNVMYIEMVQKCTPASVSTTHRSTSSTSSTSISTSAVAAAAPAAGTAGATDSCSSSIIHHIIDGKSVVGSLRIGHLNICVCSCSRLRPSIIYTSIG